MKCVYKREIKNYFHTITGYLYLSIFFAITAYYFLVNNLLAQTNDVREYFSTMITSLLFLIPILTMRLFAEEKKLKTDQLLLTLPLSVLDILLGKFLAAFTVFIQGMIMTLIFVVTLKCFGNVPAYTVVGCYLGITLAGAFFIALGLLISTFTENQIVAAILTYAILFSSYLAEMLGKYISVKWLSDIVDLMAVSKLFNQFTLGIFDPFVIIYFLSLLALCLITAGTRLRKTVRHNRVFFYLSIVFVMVFNTAVHLAVERYDLRFDMTGTELYRLSAESKKAMKEIDTSVKLYCISKNGESIPEFSKLLEQYQNANEQIGVQYVNPDKELLLLDKWKREGLEPGLNMVIVESTGNRCVLEMADMYQFSQDGTKLTYFNGESRLTSAIMQVTKEQTSHVGILMGHGEETSKELQNLIVQNNYQIQGIVLSQQIPKTVDILIMPAAQSDYDKGELKILDKFLQDGGSLVCFQDPSVEGLENLKGYLKKWGICFQENVLLDSKYHLESQPVNLLGFFVEHPITTFFQSRNYYTVVPASCQIMIEEKNEIQALVKPVLTTSETAFARDMKADDFSLKQSKEDVVGSFVIAATSEARAKAGNVKGKIFAMGSKRFYSDELLKSSSIGNSKFLSQVMAWAKEVEEEQFYVPSKQVGAEPILVLQSKAYMLGAIYIGIIPMVILAIGTGVYMKRRYL